MKIVNKNTTQHIASISVAVIFILLAVGSTPDFWLSGSTAEVPCDQIATVSSAYVITVKVSDELTGKPIPNATVDLQTEHSNFSYLGENLCKLSGAKPTYSQFTKQTNASGLVTIELPTFSYHTSLDRTLIQVSVKAENCTSSQASKVLKGESPVYQFDIKLIDLTDQP